MSIVNWSNGPWRTWTKRLGMVGEIIKDTKTGFCTVAVQIADSDVETPSLPLLAKFLRNSD